MELKEEAGCEAELSESITSIEQIIFIEKSQCGPLLKKIRCSRHRRDENISSCYAFYDSSKHRDIIPKE